MWRRLTTDGVEWEVRAVSNEPESGVDPDREEILEFRTTGHVLPPRRIAIVLGQLSEMDDTALKAAFMRARPIGGDFYGRPGKRMTDVSGA